MAYQEFNERLFDRVAAFAATPWAIALLVVWSFLEASIWVIIPDFLLGILVLCRNERWKTFLWVTLASSMAGTIAFIAFIKLFPQTAAAVFAATPFVQPRMVEAISAMYAQGIWTVLYQSFSIMAAKVWTYVAVTTSQPLGWYVGLLAVSRGVRMLLSAAAGLLVARYAGGLVRKHFGTLLAIYTAVTLAIIIVMES